MRRSLSIFLLLHCFLLSAFGQGNLLSKKLDQLKKTALAHYKLKQNRAYIDTLKRISYLYFKENPDSNWKYDERAYKLSVKGNCLIGQARAKLNFPGNYYYKKNYKKAFKELNEAYKIAIKTSDKVLIAICLNNIGLAYVQQKNYPIALKHFYRSRELAIKINDLNTDARHNTKMARNFGPLSFIRLVYFPSPTHFRHCLDMYRSFRLYQ